MKIQEIKQDNKIQVNNTPKFKGGGDIFLRYLATNQAVGANAVDVSFMVVPRTSSDMIRRGPLAGFETLRREIMGTINDTLIGAYGILAGAIAAILMGINGKYKADVNKIMAAPETLNILAENRAAQIKNNKSQKEYIINTLKNLKAFNPNAQEAENSGYLKIKESTIDEVSKIIDEAISNKDMDFRKWADGKTPNSMQLVKNKITEVTGAQSRYLLESAENVNGEKLHSITSLDTFLEDLFKVSKAFNKDDVKEAFNKQIRENKGIKDNEFIRSLTKFNKTKSVAGFLMAAAVGISVQPINMYLSKKKSGQDGFVGVEGRTKDDSAAFWALKGVSAAAFGAMILATLQTGFSKFMSKMAFKGFWPSISQLKGVYGITIISRLMSARDKDELRESFTKDTLGYLSWLVLGDFVNKIVADSLDKSVMNSTKDVQQKNWWGRIFNSKLKTRDEILIETLAKNNIETYEEKDGKIYAKSFKKMMKELDTISDNAQKIATKKRLRTLNRAQIAGYAFSGLVLGLGIPNLNIYITNKLDKKRKAKAAAEAAALENQNKIAV